MGLAFLPDSFLGVDTTITCHELGIASSIKFQEEYQLYTYQPSATPLVFFCGPHNALENSLAITKTPATEGFDKNFSTITIISTVYQVICIIFSAKSFIGHVTRVFLVQLPDGSKGILKDSWIPPARSPESKFLEGLAIPFGPQIIANFTSLLELMAVFMDIVIGMYNKFCDFFFCYLIQYFFHSYHLPQVTPEGSS